MLKKQTTRKYILKKRLLGLIFGLILSIIVLKVDKKLWLPLELETINNRNVSITNAQKRLNLGIKNDLALILFDDKTQFLLRQNGMPIKDFERRGRDLLKLAIEKLELYGARSIGLNLNLSASSNNIQTDDLLAKTISNYKNIVIADSIYSNTFLFQPNNILKSTSSLGYGELYSDYDKVVHKIKLIEHSYKNTGSFSYALFKNAFKKDVSKDLKSKNEFYLLYSNNQIPTYSFIDLIQGKINGKFFKDKVVILGISTKSKLMKEPLYTPFNKNESISDSVVQATAFANLAYDSYLAKLSINNHPFCLIILSILLGMVFSSISTINRVIITTVLLIATFTLSQFAYSSYQLLIELVPLIFVLFGNLVIGSLISLQLNLQEQNLELENALFMLQRRSTELENSQGLLKGKNLELTTALKELNKKIIEINDVKKQLSGRREEERKRIARELHDDTLARITDLKRYIETLITSLDVSIMFKQKLGITIQTLDSVTQEIRRTINALRPSMLDNALGLIPAIENLLDELRRRSNHRVKTKLVTEITKLRLQESYEINLYRIIQESLNNIFKHANASLVEITISEQPGQILFLIKDNGVGFNKNALRKIGGYGLIDMKERAELIGATLQHLSGGTILEITIPLNKVQSIEVMPSSDLPRQAATTW